MTTPIWEITEDGRFIAPFDKDAELVLPIGVTKRLADMGFPYQSHEVEVEAGLVLVGSEYSDGKVFIRIKRDPAVAVVGSTYKFTLRVKASDGQTDDQPLYLLITD